MKTRTFIFWTLLLIITDLILFQSCEKEPLIEDPIQSQTSTATLEIAVDERIELLSVVQHFTSWANKRHTKFDIAYKNELDAYFRPFANHEAIQICQELVNKGFTYDVPPAFILCHSSLPDLKQTHNYSMRVISRGGSQYKLELFVKALKSFAEESNFQGFFNSHQSFYAEIENNIKNNLREVNYIELVENYYREYKAEYSLIAAPLFHSGGYASTIESSEGDLIYSIQGPMDSENGFPLYGNSDWFEYVTLHEFSHSFVNPVTTANWYQIKQYEDLYFPIKDEMSQMAYTNWITCVNEHLVRVNVARFAALMKDENAANEILKQEYDKGFRYIYELNNRMKTYETSRGKYTCYNDFYPEIIKCFKELDILTKNRE